MEIITVGKNDELLETNTWYWWESEGGEAWPMLFNIDKCWKMDMPNMRFVPHTFIQENMAGLRLIKATLPVFPLEEE